MEQKNKTKPAKQEASMENKERIAAIRIRGIIGVKDKVEDTLRLLRLYRNNYCCVLPKNQVTLGMLKHAKDYITWGEIDDETFKMLIEKRGKEFKGAETDSKGKIKYRDFMLIDNKKIKKFFTLSPPKKGFERKGVKTPYNMGGVLGYRGEAINNLIRRML